VTAFRVYTENLGSRS